MFESKLLKIIENFLKQGNTYKNSSPLAHVLIDMLNRVDNNCPASGNRYKNNLNNNFYNDSYNLPSQNINISEHNYSNPHYAKKYNSEEHTLSSNVKNNSDSSNRHQALIDILKGLLDKHSNNIEPNNREKQSNINISDREIYNNEFTHKEQNNDIDHKSSSNNLYQEDCDVLISGKSNFIKSISIQNKSDNFRCTLIYEKYLNDNSNNSYSKEIEQGYTKPDLENGKNVSLYNEDDKNTDKDDKYIQSSQSVKNQQSFVKQRYFNKNNYDTSDIKSYKNNFKPLHYVRVADPSSRLENLFKNKVK